jgi:hypothetical protein
MPAATAIKASLKLDPRGGLGIDVGLKSVINQK